MGKDTNILCGWKQIAVYLGIHTNTCIDWARTEGLPYSKIKANILTTKTAVDKWVMSRRVR